MKKRKDPIANANIVGSRIALLRSNLNMSQQDLADRLSEMSTRKEPYSVALISSWEKGRRLPTEEMLGRLSMLFMVTEEYLRGLSDDPDSNEITDSNKPLEISTNDLPKFDGRPVFVAFANHAHEDQFAIVNADEKKLMMRSGYIQYPSTNIKAIYANEPDYSCFMSKTGRFPLDMNSLLSASSNLFWIEMINSDQIVQAKYNGWYRRNENNTALISSVGYVLPFEGLNVSYHAYLKNRVTP